MPTEPYVWLVGPCAVDTEAGFRAHAEALAEVMAGRPWWLKNSFSKSNRTMLDGAMGVHSLAMFGGWVQRARAAMPDVRFVTDIHDPHQAAQLAEYFDPERDIVQIPAMLARQTPLLVAAGAHFRTVFVKRMQSMSTRSASHVPAKVRSGGMAHEVWIGERGIVAGTETLLPDFGGVAELAPHFDRVILDSGHSTQRLAETTRGSRDLAARYFAAAPLLGYGGSFQEVHLAPESALSDRTMQLNVEELRRALAIQDAVRAALA